MLFLREAEGIYKFGSRRVNIALEKSGQLMVRVGGGFMNIEKFVEKY